MPQSRLDDYFVVPYREPVNLTKTHFLSLPIEARNRVYHEYTQLASWVVDLNYRNMNVWASGTWPDEMHKAHINCSHVYEAIRKVNALADEDVWETLEENSAMCPHGATECCKGQEVFPLLLVCKQMYQEVIRILYAKISFRICRGNPSAFKRLWNMSNLALSSLATLTIRLDIPQDIITHGDGWEDYPSLPTPIDLRSKHGSNILQEWTMLVEKLRHGIRPYSLSLNVVLRAVDDQTAATFIEPLMTLPGLKACSIWARTSRDTCPRIFAVDIRRDDSVFPTIAAPDASDKQQRGAQVSSSLAKTIHRTIQKLVVPDWEERTEFAYLKLPAELRYLILSFAGLVTTDSIQWRPPPPGFDTGLCDECLKIHGHKVLAEAEVQCLSPHQTDHGIQKRCCYECHNDDKSCLCYCSIPGGLFSSTCRCASHRHALFSVSRQVREDAVLVYYSQNRFLVTPQDSPRIQNLHYHDIWPSFRKSQLKTELSLYLSSISSFALQNIRWLEWTLPRWPPGSPDWQKGRSFLDNSCPAWLDFQYTLQRMKQGMNLRGLTFVVNMSVYGCADRLDGRLDGELHEWYFGLCTPVVLACKYLAEAELKDFFVYAPLDERVSIERKLDWERQLEQAVMGEGYISAARGKPIFSDFGPEFPFDEHQ